MSTENRLEFDGLHAPADSGEVLVAPKPAQVRTALEFNRELVKRWNVPMLDLDLGEVRRLVRQRVAGVETDQPIVVTGHQPEFIHPGVWAKHVVAVRLAEAAEGVAVNLVVDTDAPKTTSLTLPADRDGALTQTEVPWGPHKAGVPYECMPAADADGTAAFEQAVRNAIGPRFDKSMMPLFCKSLADLCTDSDLVDQTVAARRRVEHEFGIDMQERRVSRTWICPLLIEILGNASRFFDCYNAALNEFRRSLGLRGTQRPVPDLARDGQRFELPLWVHHTNGRRRRLFVQSDDHHLIMFAERAEIGRVSKADLKTWDSAQDALCELDDVAFRPRALTLTLWARLLLSDLFIHGIGGAKYDRITDLLIGRYFGIEPPRMACVTATLRLDLPRHDTSPSRERQLTRQLRDLHYNPQRYIDQNDQVAELIDARAAAIDRSRKLRKTSPSDHARRREVFREIRGINARLLEAQPQVLKQMTDRHEATRRHLRENEIADRREYFFALFDRPSLEGLCARLPDVDAFRL